MQIRMFRYHYTYARMTEIWNTDNTNAGRDVKKKQLLYIDVGCKIVQLL